MAVALFTLIIAILAVFQLALAAGAPLGRYAWGGRCEGKLPVGLRVGSAASVLLYIFFALTMLDQAGMIDVFPVGFSRFAIWVMFALLCLSAVANLASRSKRERITMTPVALLLAALTLITALQTH